MFKKLIKALKKSTSSSTSTQHDKGSSKPASPSHPATASPGQAAAAAVAATGAVISVGGGASAAAAGGAPSKAHNGAPAGAMAPALSGGSVASAKPEKVVHRPCPAYAAKSVVGQRFCMEDSWQAVPDLMTVPRWWTARDQHDHLPVVPPQLQLSPSRSEPDQANGSDQNPARSAVPAAAEAAPEAAAEAVVSPAAPPAAAAAAAAGQPPVETQLDAAELAAQYGSDPVMLHFFGVYDGHGGADVAKHCAKSLHENLKRIVASMIATTSGTTPAAGSGAKGGAALQSRSPTEVLQQEGASGLFSATTSTPCTTEAESLAAVGPGPPSRPDGLEPALRTAFLTTDAELASGRVAHEVGSTAVVTLVSATHLWVGNCGDSRALLCRDTEAVALSLDHKATRSDEVSRVEAAGGYVWWDRVMGELAVSRAIGDHCLRPFVIAEPEVTYVLRRREDQLLVLASDGLWDVFSNDEARALALDKFKGELARTGSSKQAIKKAASSLAKAALAKGSRDNITVVVVDARLPADAAGAGTAAAAAAAGSVGAAQKAGSSSAAARAGPASAAAKRAEAASNSGSDE